MNIMTRHKPWVSKRKQSTTDCHDLLRASIGINDGPTIHAIISLEKTTMNLKRNKNIKVLIFGSLLRLGSLLV